ncbi:MAG: helix-turn-helix domain-containing protein [Alloprevotella sp.]|nr:helix-turn-helix domain-containing protein [Alloprevotella sp.]
MMNEYQTPEHFFYLMLYGAVAMLSLTACCYLLFRRSNAIAPDVTPPIRLRRWVAVFFAFMTLSHAWYMPILYLSSSEDVLQCYLVGAILDFMTLIPLVIIILFSMLQDRRRPQWIAFVMVVPPIVGLAASIISHSTALIPIIYTYHLLTGIGFTIYMVRATRQYGRWLRDNYADLENKEVWQSLVVLAFIVLVLGVYSFGSKGIVYQYIAQVNNIILIGYLVWRVETLSDLSISQPQNALNAELCPNPQPGNDTPAETDSAVPQPVWPAKNIGALLQRYCIDARLYLQHDLSLVQLAKAIGTNRLYLSQYFSAQGTNYNSYINALRINHFISLYQKAVNEQHPFTAQQLAHESGFRSYSTFSAAFKRKTGMSVSAWIKDQRLEKD